MVRLKEFAHAHLLNIKGAMQSLFLNIDKAKIIENCIRLCFFVLIIKNTITINFKKFSFARE